MALNKNYQAEVGVSFNDTKLKKQLETLDGKTIKVNVEVKGGLGNLNKALKDTNKLLNETQKALRNVDEASKKLDKGVLSLDGSSKKLNSTLSDSTTKTKKAADAFNHTANHGKTFSALMTDITKKVLAFGSVTNVINMVRQAFFDSINIVRAYDEAITDLKKVSDLSGDSLQAYSDKLAELGKVVYRSRTEMVESATLFKQGGYSDDDAAKLAQIAEMYKNVADAQISSGEASAFVISQMKAFNITAEDARSIIDKVNEVSNNFAVSSTDIASGLTRNSAALAAYGNNLSESIGLITAGTEIMTNKAGQVSNGLKSIGANIAKLATQTGVLEFTANGVATSVDLINEKTGEMRNTFEVLEDVSKAWDNMSNAEKTNLALKMAGKTQVSVFTSVMGNFKTAIDANETAIKSFGSAMEENEKRADSLKVGYDSVRREVEELVIGRGGFSALIKGFLEGSQAGLKFINDTKGLPILLANLALIMGMHLIPKLKETSKELVRTGLNAVLTAVQTRSLAAGLDVLKISASGAQLALGGLSAILSLVAMGWNKYKSDMEEANRVSRQNAQDSEQNAKSLSDVVNKLKDESLRRNDLREAIGNTTSKYRDELLAIEDVNELREKGIELLKQESLEYLESARVAMEAENLKAQNKLDKSVSRDYNSKTSSYVENTGIGNVLGSSPHSTVFQFDDMKQYVEMLKQTTDAVATAVKAGEEEESVLVAVNKEYNKAKTELEELQATTAEYASYVEAIKNRLKEQAEVTGEASNALKDWFNDMSPEEVELLAKSLKVSTEEFYAQADAMGLSLREYEAYITKTRAAASAMDDTNKSIDGLQSALGTAQEAMKQYTETGLLNIDTFQELMAISPQYLSALINENGQLSVNEETLGNLIESLKIAKIEELQAAAAADIMALAHGDTAKMSDTAKGAIAELGGNVAETGDQASTATGKMLGFAASVHAAVQASKGLEGGELPDDFEAKQQAIIDAYAKIGDKISSIAVDTKNNVASGAKKGAKAAKKSAKDTTDAYKEEYQKQLADLDHKLAMGEMSETEYYEALKALNEKYFGEASGQHQKYLDEYQKNQEKIFKWEEKQRAEALKSQKETYDKALQYINDTLKKKSDALKKDRDSELKEIDSEIKYLEKRRDSQTKELEKRIKGLKEEKKVFVDGIEEQVEALDALMKAEKEHWDEKITAFKKEKELLEEQIKLQRLQESLALAKSTRVNLFVDGKFGYGEDEAAVSGAEQAIEDYYTSRNQQSELEALESSRDAALAIYSTQIEDLKNYKETMSNQYDEEIDRLDKHREEIQERYDARIEDLKEYREKVAEEYDAEIEIMDNYIENFNEMVNEYDQKQNRLALLQVAGAESEKQVWMMRLENLREFVNDYNRLKDEMDNGSTNNKVEASFKSHSPSMAVGKKATGDSSIAKDGMYLVGDDPNNQEIAIGSKLNGSLLSLSKGDGVVNAESTKTVAGLLNSIGGTLDGKLGEFEGKKTINSFTIENMTVEADNAMEFMDDMVSEFRRNMSQEAFK
jgi:TP901 family phage tail tape measure protein